MLLLRLSGSAIGGIVVGSCGFILLLVGLFFWYHWRLRRPGILPQVEVLGDEFTSYDGNGGGEAGFSAHLTPFLYNAITRYLTSSVVLSPPPPGGGDSPERPNPLSRKMRLWMRERDPRLGVASQGVVVPRPIENVVTPEEDVQNVGVQAEDVRNVRMQVEERVQDFGPISYVSENGEGPPPPDYEQATRTRTGPFRTGSGG